jgi:hypothetical protein
MAVFFSFLLMLNEQRRLDALERIQQKKEQGEAAPTPIRIVGTSSPSKTKAPKRVQKHCAVCNQLFEVRSSWVNRVSTCGKPTCSSQYHTKRKPIKPPEPKVKADRTVTKLCAICSMPFTLPNSWKDRIFTCRNSDCTSTYRSQKRNRPQGRSKKNAV